MNAEELLKKMKEKHISVNDMCRKLKMSRTAFYRKRKGVSEFTLNEVMQMVDILELDSPAPIFFPEKVS